MERTPGTRRRSWTLPASIGLVAAAVLRFASSTPPADDVVPQADRDRAVGCLALGTVDPPLERWSLRDLEEITGLLGLFLRSYDRADFEAFLALRRGDLESARRVHADQRAELADLVEQLGGARDEVPEDWIGALRAYWRAYYAWAPVQEWLPEATVFRLAFRSVTDSTFAAWQASFEDFRDALGFPMTREAYLDHHLVVPHRRSAAQLVRSEGALRWFDLALGFRTPEGSEGRLVARFVHDPQSEEWFLQRAASSLRDDPPLPPSVRRLLL